MLNRSSWQLPVLLSSFISPVILVLGSILVIDSCQSQQNTPSNFFTGEDLLITSSNNFWTGNDSLSNYLINNELSVSRAEAMAVVPGTQNIFIVGNQHTILKLSPTAKPLFHIKKVGKGPGELLWAKRIKVRNSKLYILDVKQHKISVFTLDGEFVQDVTPESGQIHAFEVTSEGHIILPNLYPAAGSTAMFKILNNDGHIIDTFGNNTIVQDDLQKTDMLGLVQLSLSTEGKLVLAFTVPGTFYLYDLDTEKLISRFNVRAGPEWNVTRRNKNELSKEVYTHVVNSVTFTSDDENILVSTGGAFKKKVSVGMIFNSEGEFAGRIFGNGKFKNPPNNLQALDDSTILISGFNQQLNEIQLGNLNTN